MKRLWLPVLLLLLLPLINASAGTINSPNGILYSNPNGSFTEQIFSGNPFAKLSNGTWVRFTDIVNASYTASSSSFTINYLGNLHTVKSVLPSQCDNVSLAPSDAGYEWNTICHVPHAGHFVLTYTINDIIADHFDGTCGFSGWGLKFSYCNFNQQLGWMNSTLGFTNNLDGTITATLTVDANQSGDVFVDPSVSLAPSDNLYLTTTLSAKAAWTYTKFLLSALPNNAVIQDAELALHVDINNNNAGTSRIWANNGTTDWNNTDSATTIANVLTTNTSNFTILGTSVIGIWTEYNVTKSAVYTFNLAKNFTLMVNMTGLGMTANTKNNNTILNIGNANACIGTSCVISFNSTYAINGYGPQLNITYVLSTTIPVVTLIYPANNTFFYGQSQVGFNFTPNDTQNPTTFGNATLYLANVSNLPVGVAGIVWGANNTNATALVNGSVNNNITVAGLSNGAYVWNVQVCAAGGCGFAGTNFTVNLQPLQEIVVTLNSPLNGSNVSGNSVSVQFTPILYNTTFSDAQAAANFTGAQVWIANVSNLPAGVAGITWGSNQTANSSVVLNNSVNAVVVSGLSSGTYVFNVNVSDQECPNSACSSPNYDFNFSNVNFTFTIDGNSPNYFVLNSPANRSTLNQAWVLYNFTVGDALTGVANATTWVVNDSNSFYFGSWLNGTGVNGTALWFNFSQGLTNGTVDFITQACDFANNCVNFSAQFNVNSTVIVGALPTPVQCSNGNYLVGKFAKINMYVANASLPLLGMSCQATIFTDNSTDTSMVSNGSMIEVGKGFYNYTFTFTVANPYLVFFNCSNSTGASWFAYKQVVAVTLCRQPTLVNGGNDMGFPVVDFTLIEYLSALIVIFLGFALVWNSKILLLFAIASSFVAAFLFTTPALGMGISVLSNVASNTSLVYDSNNNLLATNVTTVPVYQSLQNSTVGGLTLFFIALGIGLTALLAYLVWAEKFKKQKPLDENL